jgi:hypothetical protein
MGGRANESRCGCYDIIAVPGNPLNNPAEKLNVKRVMRVALFTAMTWRPSQPQATVNLGLVEEK